MRSTGPIQFFSCAKKWIWPPRPTPHSRPESFKSCATRSIRFVAFAAARPTRESPARAGFSGSGVFQAYRKPAAVACSRTASRAIFAAHGERSDPGKGSRRVVEPPRRVALASRLRRRRRRFANHAAPFQLPRGSPNRVHFKWPRLQWFARQPHVYRDEDEYHRACGGIPSGAVVWTDFLTCPNSSPCRRVCWRRSRASSRGALPLLPRLDAPRPSPASP